jgi:hypothetical protein
MVVCRRKRMSEARSPRAYFNVILDCNTIEKQTLKNYSTPNPITIINGPRNTSSLMMVILL